jgi:ketosteroid isomerase-like protein
VLAAPLLVLLAAVVAEAHGFWLVPDAFQVSEGRAVEVRGQTSTRFPTSEAAVALDRIADARLFGDTRWATLVFHVGGSGRAGGQGSDSAAVVAVVAQFHRALSEGDSLGALALMAEDAVVLESGGIETRAEFRAHHLPADIEFARAVRYERTLRRVSVRGDVAWVSSASTAQGEFRGRTVNSAGAELMVLVRTPTGWKISAIHWSSRSRRP